MAIPTMKTSDFHQGGIFVPDEISRELNMLIKDASCVEKLARHVPMTRLVQQRRLQIDAVNGYWVDALAVKPKDKPQFDAYTLTAEKMAVRIIAAPHSNVGEQTWLYAGKPENIGLPYWMCGENASIADNQQERLLDGESSETIRQAPVRNRVKI